MEIREPTAWKSAQVPQAVADCITDNHRASRSLGVPRVEQRPDGGLDYSIRGPTNGLMEFYVRIMPTDSGSTMAVYTQAPYLRETIEAGMLKGC